MRATAVALLALIALAACSKADQPKVSQAGADLNAAAKETTDAANSLASAAASDVKTAGAKAADQTGEALQTAGAKVKQAGGEAGNDAKKGAD